MEPGLTWSELMMLAQTPIPSTQASEEIYPDDGRDTHQDMKETGGKWGHHADNESQGASFVGGYFFEP